MKFASVGVALQPVLSKIAILGIKRWLASVLLLTGVLIGCILMGGLAILCVKAPEVAIGLIAEVS